MTVVQADGQDVNPVERGELRIAVAETYDVLVILPDAKAYSLFAETMDRSGSGNTITRWVCTLASQESKSLRAERLVIQISEMPSLLKSQAHSCALSEEGSLWCCWRCWRTIEKLARSGR